MSQNFTSKYNIGQSVAEGIYEDLTKAFDYLEKANFDKAFNKFKTLKNKIPSNKISRDNKEIFKALDLLYSKAHKEKNIKRKYSISVKYSEVLINELDKNNMYLPSLKDLSNFA